MFIGTQFSILYTSKREGRMEGEKEREGERERERARECMCERERIRKRGCETNLNSEYA